MVPFIKAMPCCSFAVWPSRTHHDTTCRALESRSVRLIMLFHSQWSEMFPSCLVSGENMYNVLSHHYPSPIMSHLVIHPCRSAAQKAVVNRRINADRSLVDRLSLFMSRNCPRRPVYPRELKSGTVPRNRLGCNCQPFRSPKWFPGFEVCWRLHR